MSPQNDSFTYGVKYKVWRGVCRREVAEGKRRRKNEHLAKDRIIRVSFVNADQFGKLISKTYIPPHDLSVSR